jgi:hypothetical protein
MLLAAAALAGCADDSGVRSVRSDDGSRPTVSVDAGSVTVTLVDTFSPDPPSSYSGMHAAVDLGDVVLASGFDDEGNPGQPERGALWLSTDLRTWERVGVDLSDPDDQQTIAVLVADDDVVRAFGGHLAFDDAGSPTEMDATMWTSDDGGATWDPSLLQRDAIITAVERTDLNWVAVGVSGLLDNRPMATVWTSADAGQWDPVVVEQNAQIDGVSCGQERCLAVGAVAEPGEELGGRFEPSEPDDPVDARVWVSEDSGNTWSTIGDEEWIDDSGSQSLSTITYADDLIVTCGEVPNGNDLGPAMWWSTDAGVTWSYDELSAGSRDTICESIALIDGLVVLVTRELTRSGRSRLVLLDPATGAADTAVITEYLDIGQIEAIVTIDEKHYLFGRYERDGGDLQVAELIVTPSGD